MSLLVFAAAGCGDESAVPERDPTDAGRTRAQDAAPSRDAGLESADAELLDFGRPGGDPADAAPEDAGLDPKDAGPPGPAPWPGPCEVEIEDRTLGEGVYHRRRYRYDGDLLVESSLDIFDDGELDSVERRRWDEAGRLLEIEADLNGNGEIEQRIEHEYDGDLLIGRRVITGDTAQIERWRYDPPPRLSVIEIDAARGGAPDGVLDEIVTHSYDLAGRLQGRSWDLLADGVIDRVERRTYSRESALVRLEEDSDGDGVWDRVTVWRRALGPLPSSRREDTDNDGNVDYEVRWTRDEAGNVLTEEEDLEGNLSVDLISTYDYRCWTL